MPSDICCTIKLVSNVSLKQQKALYVAAGWCDADQDDKILAGVVAGSFLVAAAIAPDGSLAGMGRMISDGVGDAYIQDVIVRDDLRGHGIGSGIVGLLAAEAKRRGIRWVGLVAAPGTTPFYERLGFRAMKDHVPMLLDQGKDSGDL